MLVSVFLGRWLGHEIGTRDQNLERFASQREFRGSKTGPFCSRRVNELDLAKVELSCSGVGRPRMDTSAQESLRGHPCPAGVI